MKASPLRSILRTTKNWQLVCRAGLGLATAPNILAFFLVPLAALLMAQAGWGQTLHDSFSDGNFTASPAWGGNTTAWGIQANSDAAAGATGSNTLRLNSTAVSQTVYLSSQIGSWGTSQEWGVWVGRRAQAFTSSNQAYFWLVANESNLTSTTVDGYRLAIGDDSGGDDIRLEYVVNGAVSATVLTSLGSLTNGLTDIGFLVRVTRSSSGAWALFTSTLPTSNGTGAIATGIPNATNASVSQGTGTNNSLVPAANNYIGVAALHSTGASAIVSTEFDQIYFTPPADTTNPTLATLSPADDAIGVAVSANLVATFSEPIQAGSGDIVIKKTLDDSVVATIPVGDAQVTIAGSTLTINPTADLAVNTGYYVQIAATAIDDLAGNSYDGITNTTSWSFTTILPDTTNPTLATLSPVDDATGVAVSACRARPSRWG